MGVRPSRVEITIFAYLFVGMPSEEVPLRLGQVRRQPGTAVRVKVAQRSTQCRNRHAAGIAKVTKRRVANWREFNSAAKLESIMRLDKSGFLVKAA